MIVASSYSRIEVSWTLSVLMCKGRPFLEHSKGANIQDALIVSGGGPDGKCYIALVSLIVFTDCVLINLGFGQKARIELCLTDGASCMFVMWALGIVQVTTPWKRCSAWSNGVQAGRLVLQP